MPTRARDGVRRPPRSVEQPEIQGGMTSAMSCRPASQQNVAVDRADTVG
ncbi:MAG: hypothetical protein QM713_10250 [Arachnia sp.]